MKTYKNYYAILDVAASATQEQLKKAFRKLALKYHPDRNSDNSKAEALFKEVSEAYEILSNKEKRRAFNEYYLEHFAKKAGAAVRNATKTSSKGSAKERVEKVGKNLIYHLNITFAEAINGSEKKISYVRMAHGSRQTSNVSLPIPAGIRDGKKLRLRGAGESLSSQQTPGDLVVVVHLIPDPQFVLDGDDLILTVPLSPLDILLQDKMTIPTPAGPVSIDGVDWAQIQNPTLRLKDRGFPIAENSKQRGDLFVRFIIEVPPSIDENLKKQLQLVKKALPKTKAQIEFEKLLR